MAKPIQLPSGAWRIQWFDASGIRRGATFKTFEAARSALRRKEIEVEDIRAGRARPLSDLTLTEASVQWLADRAPHEGAGPDVARRRGRRVEDNRRHLDTHILPFMGDRKLADVTPELVQRFIRKLEATPTARKGERNAKADEKGNALVQRTLSTSTIATVLITLRKMLRDLGYPISISFKVPTTDYGWIKVENDVGRFLEACDPPWFRMSCELAVYAGLRWGEVVGLRWDRIDFDRGVIQVDRSYDGPTKSKHVRAVPLAPELAERLKRWRLATGAASKGVVIVAPAIQRGARDPEPVKLDELTDLAKRTRRACKAAAIDPVTFHQLRHTFASHLASRVALPVVGAVLGHADPKTTARYAHIDTAALARDPRLHLTFGSTAGKVVPLASAHGAHTKAATGSDDDSK